MSAEGTELRFKVVIDLSCGDEVDPNAVHDAFRDYLEEQLENFPVEVDNEDYDPDDEESEEPELISYTVSVDTIREMEYEEL